MSSEDGVKEWTSLIVFDRAACECIFQTKALQRRYGFAFVENCPVTPDATEKLLERIAFIRPTHYGLAPASQDP